MLDEPQLEQQPGSERRRKEREKLFQSILFNIIFHTKYSMRNNNNNTRPTTHRSQHHHQQPLLLGHRNNNNNNNTASSPYAVILAVGALCLACMSLIPIILLETTSISTVVQQQQQQQQQQNSWSSSAQVAVHDLMYKAWQFTHPDTTTTTSSAAAATGGGIRNKGDDGGAVDAAAAVLPVATRQTKDGRTIPDIHVHDLLLSSSSLTNHHHRHNHSDERFRQQNNNLPLARGVAGRPMSETPALQNGAQRAHIECSSSGEKLNVDSLAYWNDPTGQWDIEFRSPFDANNKSYSSTDKATAKSTKRTTRKYISFSTDRGGWNNVRMSLEILFVIAAATGRTLVLPPKEPLYLMHHDKENRYRGFADFFPIHTAAFQQRVQVITFEEFFQLEAANLVPFPADVVNRENVEKAADHCDKREKSSNACKHVFDYLAAVADFLPDISALHTCLVFDRDTFEAGIDPAPAVQEHLQQLCGEKRDIVYWTKDEKYHEADLIHFRAAEKQYRLLTHFYGMIHFTDPAIDNHYKRFVRDFLHYHDAIYCAAGKIVKAVQWEGQQRGFVVDENGAGAYSALHVRRGDLQYKKVKIPAQEWYDNTKEVWQPKEILYIATDERDKSFFDDLAKHHDLRFLDDYWDMAGLGDLDPNYMGMIDTIVASRGRAFAGTWFSTFSGYINRLRGYHGMSMMDSWYSFLPKKEAVHEWNIVDHFAYAFEWPDGWIGIDADVWPSRDKF